MKYSHSKTEFLALVAFLLSVGMVLTNGFSNRIFAQSEDEVVYNQIEPIGEVLAEILDNYVYEPDMERAVEGALMGIMSSLDRNSSFIPAQSFTSMREDTEGSFDGIGVHIRYDDDNNILVYQPIPGAPAAEAGMMAGDFIVGVDGVETSDDMEAAANTQEALDVIISRIKGPRGSTVDVTVARETKPGEERERFTYTVRRGKIPLNSILEARVLQNGIGYVRISDFKKNTADDVKDKIKEFEDQQLSAMIIDLRWNPGGLLNASQELCELFLEKGSLVTFTRGREQDDGQYLDDMKLYTRKHPVIPETMPVIVLVSSGSASSSEIVTGALQFYKRAIIIGEKTFGKGSVQTVIPLSNPKGSALRLTTALYYTPADVTIDQMGILPDIEVEMTIEEQNALRVQMIRSMNAGPEFINDQNHGPVTGNTTREDDEELVNDIVLERAIEVLRESPNFKGLIDKYHRAVTETQRMASDELREKKVR
jgi:carboxyl-terminal processing protease